MRCAVGGAFWTGCQKQILNMALEGEGSRVLSRLLTRADPDFDFAGLQILYRGRKRVEGSGPGIYLDKLLWPDPTAEDRKSGPRRGGCQKVKGSPTENLQRYHACAVGGAFWTGCQKQILKMPSRERTAGSYHVFLHVQIRTSTLLACSFLKKEGNAWKRQAQEFVWIKSCGLTPRRRMRDN